MIILYFRTATFGEDISKVLKCIRRQKVITGLTDAHCTIKFNTSPTQLCWYVLDILYINNM